MMCLLFQNMIKKIFFKNSLFNIDTIYIMFSDAYTVTSNVDKSFLKKVLFYKKNIANSQLGEY